jgi:hypothetical protein
MNRHNPRVRVAFRTMPKFSTIATVYSRFVPLGSSVSPRSPTRRAIAAENRRWRSRLALYLSRFEHVEQVKMAAEQVRIAPPPDRRRSRRRRAMRAP